MLRKGARHTGKRGNVQQDSTEKRRQHKEYKGGSKHEQESVDNAVFKLKFDSHHPFNTAGLMSHFCFVSISGLLASLPKKLIKNQKQCTSRAQLKGVQQPIQATKKYKTSPLHPLMLSLSEKLCVALNWACMIASAHTPLRHAITPTPLAVLGSVSWF